MFFRNKLFDQTGQPWRTASLLTVGGAGDKPDWKFFLRYETHNVTIFSHLN